MRLRDLTPRALASAIARMCSEPGFAEHAGRMATRLRAEDAGREVVRAVDRLLRVPLPRDGLGRALEWSPS
jgi:hypothetical protein